jgi:GMP synthase (glutamine-hydrolysing)
VQFHPEIDGEVMRAYLEARREPVEAEGLPWERILLGVNDAPAGRQTLRNFVRHVVPKGA